MVAKELTLADEMAIGLASRSWIVQSLVACFEQMASAIRDTNRALIALGSNIFDDQIVAPSAELVVKVFWCQ